MKLDSRWEEFVSQATVNDEIYAKYERFLADWHECQRNVLFFHLGACEEAIDNAYARMASRATFEGIVQQMSQPDRRGLAYNLDRGYADSQQDSLAFLVPDEVLSAAESFLRDHETSERAGKSVKPGGVQR